MAFSFASVFAALCSVWVSAFQIGAPTTSRDSTRGTFTGEVVAIADGDTIRVMHNGVAERIRLWGIDCPETGQPFGTRAKQLTGELAFGKEVTVRVSEVDRYGRTLAEITLPDGRSLNRELVSAGLAWWYQRYAPIDDELATLEAKARDGRLGLWSDANPTAPWEWRHSGSSPTGRSMFTDRPRSVRARGEARNHRRSGP
jgi:endonuclease YncB( thermonuclease family)